MIQITSVKKNEGFYFKHKGKRSMDLKSARLLLSPSVEVDATFYALYFTDIGMLKNLSSGILLLYTLHASRARKRLMLYMF